jgi:hypothetical protein
MKPKRVNGLKRQAAKQPSFFVWIRGTSNLKAFSYLAAWLLGVSTFDLMSLR